MAVATYEQEFNITHTRGDDLIEMYVSDTLYMTKLDKLVNQFPDTYKVKEEYYCQGELTGRLYTFPTKLLSFRSPRQQKELTDEQRKAIGERLRKSR